MVEKLHGGNKMMLQSEDWEMQIKGELTEAAFPKAKINDTDHSIHYKVQPLVPSLLIYLRSCLVVPHFDKKQTDPGPPSPLRKLRSFKHFRAGNLCTVST